MVYFHCRSRIRTRIPNPVVTLYYAVVFLLHGLRLGSLSWMGTVPILGMDLHPKERSSSQLHTFQSGDQSPKSKPVEKFSIVQESISELESESDADSGNKPLWQPFLCTISVNSALVKFASELLALLFFWSD